jgi:hypothetical protein
MSELELAERQKLQYRPQLPRQAARNFVFFDRHGSLQDELGFLEALETDVLRDEVFLHFLFDVFCKTRRNVLIDQPALPKRAKTTDITIAVDFMRTHLSLDPFETCRHKPMFHEFWAWSLAAGMCGNSLGTIDGARDCVLTKRIPE